MPNYKSLKTYSKTQKVVNYSTLFETNKEPYDFDSSDSSSHSSEQAKGSNPPAETKVKANSKKIQKKSLLQLPLNDVVPEISPVTPTVDLRPKKMKKADKAKNAVKLFEMSNANSTSSASTSSSCETTANATNPGTNNTCGDIEEKMKGNLIICNDDSAAAKSEAVVSTRGRPKRMASSSSATNLKQQTSAGTRGRAKVVEKENKIESKTGRVKKSKSTSNILTTKKIQLISSDANRSDLTTEVSKIKSIMKSSVEEGDNGDDGNKSDKLESKKVVKVKKAVKILEQIDDKNDQISNFKFDNRTKHAASTSTPSGLRRRPLKMPQELSIIVTPGKKA